MRAELAENFIAFCLAFNISLFDWQREDFGEALRREDGRFVHRLSGISVPRGDGELMPRPRLGYRQLICGRAPHHISTSALDREGGKVMLQQARRMVRNHPRSGGCD